MKEYKVKVYSDRIEWFNLEGKLHREDGPAVEWANGDKCYYINGKLHREDGPALEFANGDKAYYINDEYLTEEEFNNRNKSCENKIVEIEGVKYKLSKV
jgi:hypothetical protein